MQLNDFILYAVFVAGNALFLGSRIECYDVAFELWQADRNVADTLEVREDLI